MLHFVVIVLTLWEGTLSWQYQYDLENMYYAGNIKHEKQNCIEYAAILAHTRQFFIALGNISLSGRVIISQSFKWQTFVDMRNKGYYMKLGIASSYDPLYGRKINMWSLIIMLKVIVLLDLLSKCRLQCKRTYQHPWSLQIMSSENGNKSNLIN